jgi:hypothetical protein
VSAVVFPTLAALLSRVLLAGMVRWLLIAYLSVVALRTRDADRRVTAVQILVLLVRGNHGPSVPGDKTA